MGSEVSRGSASSSPAESIVSAIHSRTSAPAGVSANPAMAAAARTAIAGSQGRARARRGWFMAVESRFDHLPGALLGELLIRGLQLEQSGAHALFGALALSHRRPPWAANGRGRRGRGEGVELTVPRGIPRMSAISPGVYSRM